MHVDHVGLRVEMIVPDVFQKHGPGDDLAGMFHQILEQTELARLQHDFIFAASDPVRQAVELKIGNPIDRLLARADPPARQHFDAREQL